MGIACGVFLLLGFFYYHIDKWSGGIPFYAFDLILLIYFVSLLAVLLSQLIGIIQNRKFLPLNIYIPALFVLTTLSYTVFSPYRLSSESFESDIVLRGCFEGTQNQAFIKFRKDQTFELNWTGVFGYNDWFYGKYSQHGDTLFLDYETEEPPRFGDTILNNGNGLVPINKDLPKDKTYLVGFYLGYCQGYN